MLMFISGTLDFYAQKQLLISACLSHCNSVCLSVCYTGGSVKNDASYDHQIFTVGCMEDSSFRNHKAFPEIRRGSPRTREL